MAVENSLHVGEVAAGGAERHAWGVVDGGCDGGGRGQRRRRIGCRVGAGCGKPSLQVAKFRPHRVDLGSRHFSLVVEKGRWGMSGGRAGAARQGLGVTCCDSCCGGGAGGSVSRRGRRGGHKQQLHVDEYLKARWEEDSICPKPRALRA